MTKETEKKGELLGHWLTPDGLKQLGESECKIEEDFSNDSESYSNKSIGKTRDYFSEEEIREAARKMYHQGVGRYINSLVNSYLRSYSWGGYVWTPLGPVNRWTTGESAGFEVDGVDIVVRASSRNS